MSYGFFRLIFYAVLIYLVYRILRFLFSPAPQKRQPDHSLRLSGTMVKDETCQIYLPREDAIKEILEGKEYFFCSQECRRKFLEARKR